MNRSIRNSRFNHVLAVALMGCFVEAATAGAAENTAGAPAPEVQKVGAAAKKEIINGRMPVTVVYMARFGNTKDEATKAQADLFGTTVGKIDDIKKNRNFAYVTDAFRPTEAQKNEALAWLKSHPYYDAAGVDKLITELDAIPVATAEEAAAFEKVRTEARGQLTTTKEGEPAAAGGGNRRKPRAKKGEGVQGGTEPAPEAKAAAATTGDALLA